MPTTETIAKESTPGQRQAIVCAGRALGLDLDGIRELTPAGSLRALTFDEAAAVLERLDAERQRRNLPVVKRARRRRAGRPLGKVTKRQARLIDEHRERIGWTAERLDVFLARTFNLTAATLKARRDASRVIAVLGQVLEHKLARRARQEAAADAARAEGWIVVRAESNPDDGAPTPEVVGAAG